MRSTTRKILYVVTLLFGVVFLVLVINQTAQIVSLAATLHPVAGQATLWALLIVYAACLLVPVILFLRLPAALSPPESTESPEFQRHLNAVGSRLRDHPLLDSRPLSTREDIEGALGALNGQADEVIRQTAGQVFVSTAISQNGSLDAILVLVTQSKMIWKLAHVYYQRPTIRDFSRLYANVAGTAFVAGELEDLDLAEQLQPVVSGVVGSAAGAIPGLHTVSSLFASSVLTGTTNAFLTLRVGIIAKQYCTALVTRPKRSIRQSAVAEAALMLGSIVAAGTRRVSSALLKASGQKVTGAVRDIGERVRDAGTSIAGKLKFRETS